MNKCGKCHEKPVAKDCNGLCVDCKKELDLWQNGKGRTLEHRLNISARDMNGAHRSWPTK